MVVFKPLGTFSDKVFIEHNKISNRKCRYTSENAIIHNMITAMAKRKRRFQFTTTKMRGKNAQIKTNLQLES